MALATPRVCILLSTYNGSAYLAEQLDSLLAQTYANLFVLVRDDGSSDSTVAMVQDYQSRHPEQIRLVEDEAGNLGPSGSFSALLQYALKRKEALGLTPFYALFCDQDDVWYPDKVEKSMAAMLLAEERSPDAPVLVHSDLEVVDADNKHIAPSLADYQGLEIERRSFPNLLISNLVTGCTALLNEPLAMRALPVHNGAIMHDWWLALVAAAFGEVVYLHEPLVRYRQHGGNAIGAKQKEGDGPGRVAFWRRVLAPSANVHLLEVAAQAQAFWERFGADMDRTQRRAVRLCAGMGIRSGVIQRAFYRLARRC